MLERVWGKGNPPTLLVGMQIGETTMENSVEVPLKTKSRVTIWSTNPTPGHTSRENFNLKKTHALHPYNVHSSALFTIAKTCKQPIHRWMDKERLPRWPRGKESACQCRRCKKLGLYPWARKIPQRRKWHPTLVFLPGKSHGRGAWQDTVHGVTEIWTQLNDWAHTHILFGSVVKNPPANAGDVGSIPDLGGSHMPRSN